MIVSPLQDTQSLNKGKSPKKTPMVGSSPTEYHKCGAQGFGHQYAKDGIDITCPTPCFLPIMTFPFS